MENKILVIASYANSLIHFRLHLMLAFKAKGYKIIACAPNNDDIAAKLAQYGIQFIPVNVQRTGINPLADIIFLYKLCRIIKREKVNALFSYTIKPVIYGSLAGKISGVKHIYSMITGLGYAFSATSVKSRTIGIIAMRLFKSTLKYNRKIFFQNPDNQHEFIGKRLVPAENTVLINGSGVDIAAFCPKAYPQKLTFLMIARLLIDKGTREYFQAAKIVKKRYPHVNFLLVGWLDQNPNAISRKELENYIEANVVHYVGEVADVRPIIAESSVYVLPSYCEGTPRTVLEAMAMARPIITTDVPGCRETVIHGHNGFLVRSKNVNDLVDAMYEFIHNPKLIEKMGNHSRQIATEKYDVDKVNAMILQNMLL